MGPTVGAIVAGDHIVLRPWARTSSDNTAWLTSLSLSDGRVEWTIPSDFSLHCAPHTLGDILPCITQARGENQSELQFIDVDSGEVSSTATIPFYGSMIDTDGHSVYTAGYDPEANGFTVTKGSPDDPTGDWKTTIQSGLCEDYTLGDAWDFRIGHGLVWGFSGGGATAVLRDVDGSPMFDHDVADVWVTEGPRIVSRRCEPGGDPDQWMTDVADINARVLFSTPERLQQFEMQVYAGNPPPFVTQSGDALDATTGAKLWHIDVSDLSYYWPLLVGNVSMWQSEQGLAAYDMRSGQQMWDEPTVMNGYGLRTYGALTDGERVFLPADSGGINVLGIADGSRAWSYGAGTDGDATPALYATSEGIVAVTYKDARLLRPTGPPARVPSSAGPGDENTSGTELVTKCGQPPQFLPEAIRADSGALVITMRIVAKCPGGDVLSGRQTRLAVTSDGQNVASAVFDLSTNPIVIGPESGGSTGEPYVTHEFRFPVGTFWRIPVSVDEAPGNGVTQKGAVDLEATRLLIDCEEEGSTTDTAGTDANTGSQSSTAVGAANAKTGDNESASFDALRAIANSDRPFVAKRLADRWVPQLSSKRPGLVADGIVWNNAEILREHLDLRLKYPEVRLLWTGEWSTFSVADFWVTIAGMTFPDAEGALAWCRDHGLDHEHCYAKLVSTTHPIDGSTAFNK